jgi:CBS domain-containing membrane protein
MSELRQCTVVRRRGDSRISFEPTARNPSHKPHRTGADQVPLLEIMSRELVCASPELELSEVVSLMASRRIGCLPVVDDRRHPIGVITKFDLLEQLDVTMHAVGVGSPMPSDLAARVADEVMMPIALFLDERATVAHAAAMMTVEDTHHVLVVRETGELIGVVSSKDIVSWLVANDDLVAKS